MIYHDWEAIPDVPLGSHDHAFLHILHKHGFRKTRIPVPLQARYTKGRRWSVPELQAAINAWHAEKSITFVAACLNRNPQDMIYKLLDYCKSNGLEFTQKHRSESSANWGGTVKECAEELFEHGLPAWKIAALFRVDFEHVEKELFGRRKQYGHQKKNPFAINTDHKQWVNTQIVNGSTLQIRRALEPFAGEGRFTQTLLRLPCVQEIICIEQDEDTLGKLRTQVLAPSVRIIAANNLTLLGQAETGLFDLVDLDPFITCHEQLPLVWQHLNDQALLFVTFGGEYRRSFIRTNRQAIANRYGYFDEELGNSAYLEAVPEFFLGHVAALATRAGFSFEVERAVRYANNCRFWLKVTRTALPDTQAWLKRMTRQEQGGYRFTGLAMPRFKEVRFEIDQMRMTMAKNG